MSVADLITGEGYWLMTALFTLVCILIMRVSNKMQTFMVGLFMIMYAISMFSLLPVNDYKNMGNLFVSMIALYNIATSS